MRQDANRRVTEQDLSWSDVIFLMERRQLHCLRESFPQAPFPRCEVLDIPDDYEFMDPALVELLLKTVSPQIAILLAEKS